MIKMIMLQCSRDILEAKWPNGSLRAEFIFIYLICLHLKTCRNNKIKKKRNLLYVCKTKPPTKHICSKEKKKVADYKNKSTWNFHCRCILVLTPPRAFFFFCSYFVKSGLIGKSSYWWAGHDALSYFRLYSKKKPLTKKDSFKTSSALLFFKSKFLVCLVWHTLGLPNFCLQFKINFFIIKSWQREYF